MYIGTKPQSGFITTAKQRVTSSTNNYVDLDHSISSLADVIVFVNFVKQDYTNLTLTTSSRITLGGTLVASDIVEIAYLGKAVATQNPSTNSVTNDMLSGSIANSKLANSSITLNGSAVSLGGSATVGGTNTPNFHVKTSSQSISASTNTTVIFSAEDFDTASLYNTSDGKFTVTSDYTGKYFFYASVKYASSSISRNDITINKNGTAVLRTEFGNSTSYPTVLVSGMVNLSSASDYVTVVVNQNDGTKSLSGEAEGNFFGGYKIIE